ncbi:MAG: hypothetical protein H0T47_08430 [Planctomycetaceae bacterium]|nr:hypothetical protein [Planctomycetaceae bacterium]
MTSENRQRLRTALRVYQRLTAEAKPSTSPLLPLDTWRELLAASRRVMLAEERGWPGAAVTARNDYRRLAASLTERLGDSISNLITIDRHIRVQTELLLVGITIVFTNRVSEPRTRGKHYFAEDVLLLLLLLHEYTQNGEFLTKLAGRLLETQISLRTRRLLEWRTAPVWVWSRPGRCGGAGRPRVAAGRDRETGRLSRPDQAEGSSRRIKTRLRPGSTCSTCMAIKAGGTSGSPTT